MPVPKQTDVKIIFTATRESDRMRLYLLNRNTKHSGYVVCWNYDPASGTWDWGTYCDDLMGGLSAFMQKCTEHDFNEVFEGYQEL